MEDCHGNVWINESRRRSRMSREQIMSVTEFEGAPERAFDRIVEDCAGNISYATLNGGVADLRWTNFMPGSLRGCFRTTFRIRRPSSPGYHRGDWWVALPGFVSLPWSAAAVQVRREIYSD